MSKTTSLVAATIAYLKVRQAARAAGHPVYMTTDPAWLLDMAINRRAGWLDTPGEHGSAQPVNGKLPRYADGDMQRHLSQLAHRLNTPRLIVRRGELGSWGRYLDARIPDRITYPGDES